MWRRIQSKECWKKKKSAMLKTKSAKGGKKRIQRTNRWKERMERMTTWEENEVKKQKKNGNDKLKDVKGKLKEVNLRWGLAISVQWDSTERFRRRRENYGTKYMKWGRKKKANEWPNYKISCDVQEKMWVFPPRNVKYVLLSKDERGVFWGFGSIGTEFAGIRIGWGIFCFIHVTTLQQKNTNVVTATVVAVTV